jgi:hypothetical protein
MASKPGCGLSWCAAEIGNRVGKLGKRIDANAIGEAQENVVEHGHLPVAKPMAVGEQQMGDLAQDAGPAFAGAHRYRCLDFGGDQIDRSDCRHEQASPRKSPFRRISHGKD